MSRYRSGALAEVVAVLGILGCSQSPTGPDGNQRSGLVADFSLSDVNANSLSHNQQISPRQFLQQASAWYFGHST